MLGPGFWLDRPVELRNYRHQSTVSKIMAFRSVLLRIGSCGRSFTSWLLKTGPSKSSGNRQLYQIIRILRGLCRNESMILSATFLAVGNSNGLEKYITHGVSGIMYSVASMWRTSIGASPGFCFLIFSTFWRAISCSGAEYSTPTTFENG